MSDLISRQAAIDALRMDIDIIPFVKAREYARAVIETVYNRLEELPPAQRWIPCSERMPKTREWVLCQCRAGIMDVLRLTENGDWNKNYPHAEYMSGFVIAWMPLPEQYKEDYDENK